LLFKAITKAAELTSFKECAQLEFRLAQRYKEFEASTEEEKTTKALAALDDFFVPLEAEEAELFNFDFDAYLKEHQEDKEFANGASISTAAGKDVTQACPYLAGKVTANGDSAVPSDHPQIPGVDFSDPEAAKACPYLASKENETEDKKVAAAAPPPPSDHPSIPGVDFSDPEAMKACPFLSAKNKREEAKAKEAAAKAKEESSALPSDHPVIPGVDFSNPDAIKACPFLSSQQQQQQQQA
jgi:hypothetical protein